MDANNRGWLRRNMLIRYKKNAIMIKMKPVTNKANTENTLNAMREKSLAAFPSFIFSASFSRSVFIISTMLLIAKVRNIT